MSTYSDASYDRFWRAVSAACGLFGELAREVGLSLGYIYNGQDETNMLAYLKWVMEDWKNAAVKL